MLKVTSKHMSMVENHMTKAFLSAVNNVQNMVMVNRKLHPAQFGTLWTVIKCCKLHAMTQPTASCACSLEAVYADTKRSGKSWGWLIAACTPTHEEAEAENAAACLL